MSIISQIDPIDHWKNTEVGTYYGNPNYGNNFYELIFTTLNDKPLIISKISSKILKDLGVNQASRISEIGILYNNEDNLYYLAIVKTPQEEGLNEF